MIHVKRIYDAPAPADGYRILVDRLWPRGIAKDAARMDRWLKEVAPSTALRKWLHQDPARWHDFRERYTAELAGSSAVEELLSIIRQQATVTFLYAAKDEAHNHALVLRDYVNRLLH
ncbi:DUF488 domain-containing protein [Chitinophaga japonensis]|uniref:Uncharacterized protein YeaO (DUF488 family) n=1 Tax=Chitinophaga japonensis TaxID=104662 RepID=A0A562SSN2_CHIJA|nr:DUF488 domain-containing protein [Chitinophaga japonensis]TWI84255.1 uncharacterized protein YeaO (DUF488 family) [Chitinophaga japonensis]